MTELLQESSAELRTASPGMWALVDTLIQKSVELGTTPLLKDALLNLTVHMLEGSSFSTDDCLCG